MQKNILPFRIPFVFICLVLVAMLGLVVLFSGTVPGDEYLLLLIRPGLQNSIPTEPDTLTSWMQLITALGGYRALASVTAGMALFVGFASRRWLSVFGVVAVVTGALVLSHGMKMAINRPRPQILPHLVEVTTASFPSGHAFLSTTVYLLLACLLSSRLANRSVKQLAWVGSVLIAAFVGLSRIYLGVHWPSDVLAGWALGVAWVAYWCPSLSLLWTRNNRQATSC